MKSKRTGARTLSGITSQRSLARAVNRDPAAVNRWLRDPRWPFSQSGPWDPAKVKAWANKTLAEDPAATTRAHRAGHGPALDQLGPERQVKVALNMEKLEAAKLARGIKAGDYHSVVDCTANRSQQIRAVKEQLLDLDRLILSPALEGKTREQVAAAVRERVLQILHHFAGQGPNPRRKSK